MDGRRALVRGQIHLLQPGEFDQHPDLGWYACTPNGHLANLSRHQVTEHEDGTITVSPSILVSTSRDGVPLQVWHGFLERGTWRSC